MGCWGACIGCRYLDRELKTPKGRNPDYCKHWEKFFVGRFSLEIPWRKGRLCCFKKKYVRSKKGGKC